MASETITHPDGATHPDDGAPQAPGDLPLPTGTAGPMPAPPEKNEPADEPLPAAEEIARIVESRHDQPHRVLGPHRSACGTATVVRAYLPQARRVILRTPGATPEAYPMRRIHALGLFQARVAQPFDPSALGPLDYVLEIEDDGGARYTTADPYRFRAARFSADDEALFTHGRHLGLTGLLGAHPGSRNGVAGVAFAVWAPGAARVSVVGGFNGWDGRRHPMQRVSASGIWELFIPGVGEGDLYKFEIKTPADAVFLKPDPFALRSEPPPHRAGIVCALPAPSAAARPDAAGDRVAGDRVAGDRVECGMRGGVHGRLLEWPAATDAQAWWRELGRLLDALSADGHTHAELAPSPAADPASLLAFAPFADPDMPAALGAACAARGLGVMLRDPGLAGPVPPDLHWFDGTRLFESGGGTGPASSPPPPLRFDLGKGEVRSILLSIRAGWFADCRADALSTDEAGAALLAPLLDDLRSNRPGFRVVLRAPADVAPGLAAEEIARLVRARCADPHALLGPHAEAAGGGAVIRAMLPGAEEVQVVATDAPWLVRSMRAIDAAGLFEARLPDVPADYRLSVFAPGEPPRQVIDPYAIASFRFGEADKYLFNQGNHYRIYEKLGAHPRTGAGIVGTGFAVWAPDAEGVSVVGPFNGWDGRVHQMRRHGVSGVWETFVPGIGEGALYKFEIRARNGHAFPKSDPYAFATEVPPATGSVVRTLDGVHDWQDQTWMERRRTANPWAEPIAIYEVHAGSWMRHPDGAPLNWRQLAAKLVPYVRTLGFTHIELLPIAEHPYEPSWGYQVSNFYAPTSRFGDPADLMAFVDDCHRQGIGVILDWVPGHFPKDAHALAWFDGTHLYEHADPRQGEHPDWGTLIFNYGRHEVENFLIANALFWLETYHFDGFRVDAVASMLYLDYSRGVEGTWIPNQYGGRENLEAIEFLKHVNSILHARFPGILMIAEESTSWPMVSRPADHGGLGFGFKWNMGWMHDVLAYFSTPTEHRTHHHGKLTFGLMYAFTENYILSLSHDEVVHLKRSLLGKMPGEEWARFANLRLLFAFMYAHPGKKLLFMGGELGQEGEWDHARALDWRALQKKPNRALGWFFQDLNALYREEPALHEQDFKAVGFEWLDVDSADDCTLAFLRKAREPRDALVFAANFSAVSRPWHRVGVPYPVAYEILFDSNAARYGGTGEPPGRRRVHAEDVPWHGREFSIPLPLPALSGVVLKPAPPAHASVSGLPTPALG